MSGNDWNFSNILSTGGDADAWLQQAESLTALKEFVGSAHQPDDGAKITGPVKHDQDAIDFYNVSDGDLSDIAEDADLTLGAMRTGNGGADVEKGPLASPLQQADPAVAGAPNAMSDSLQTQSMHHQDQAQPVQGSQAGGYPQVEQSVQMPQSFAQMLGPAPQTETNALQQAYHGAVSGSHLEPIVQFGHPGTSCAPVVPPDLLYDPTQPGQMSEHRIYTLGPVTLDQDEFAATIVTQQMGVELPDQQQARLYVEPISFTETFFGTGGYPRLRETARPPGLRQKQADPATPAPESMSTAEAGVRLTRDGRLRHLDSDVDLQWEHDVLDLSAVNEDPSSAFPHTGAITKSKAASTPSVDPSAPPRAQLRHTVVHPAAPLSKDVVEVEDLWQETLAEDDQGIALCCLAAVPDWENDIEWGTEYTSANQVQHSKPTTPADLNLDAIGDAEPIEWDSDSNMSERTGQHPTAKSVQLGARRQPRTSALFAERYGWDNARPAPRLSQSSLLAQRKTMQEDNTGVDQGRESDSTEATVDAVEADRVRGRCVPTAPEWFLDLQGSRTQEDKDREKLLDAGLWAPGVSIGAAMPSYLGLVPQKASADEAEDSAGKQHPVVASTPQIEILLHHAQKVDNSGLVPSFGGPESKLEAGRTNTAARVIHLARYGLVVLNANDASMTFEVLPNVPQAAKAIVESAAAEVIVPPPLPKKDADSARLAAAHEDKVAREFAAFNVSNDAKYRKTRVGRLADIAVRTGLLHAPIATNLSQLPLPNTLTQEELLRPHHPRNAWWIVRKSLTGDPAQIRVVFQSLPGLSRQVDLPANSAGQVTVRQLWEMVESAFLPDGPMAGVLSLFKPGATGSFEELDISGAMDKSLVDVGLMEPVNQVIVRSRQVQLLPVPRALSTLPSQPTVLQALYGTRKKLTATQWHVYGVEHMLPRAFVINHPGMGATLQTFFRRPEGREARKASGVDVLADLNTMAEGPNAWRVGQLTPLGAQDASPFRIGDADPSVPLLTIETGSSIAVAAPHDAGRNYLLIRRPSGQMLLRKFTGCFLVGQQQPKIPVMQPASQTCREVEDSRLVAWVHRTLRRKQNKLARENSGEERPSVSIKELVERFAPPCLSQYSGLDVNLTEGSIVSILQSRCHLVPSVTNPDEYVLPEGARIHTEDELCTMIGPDSVCALESMRSGLVRLDATGLRRHEDLAKCPLEKLALLAHMLPRRSENRSAALVAVTSAVSAPWVLTENFINCTKKDTQKMFLCISGLGDPSGRGLAMSYVKDMKRLGKDPVNRMLSKQEAPSITGTVSDLRKLPHKQVGEMLVKEFNVPAETVETLDRWERIGVLRELSNQACVAGQANELGPRYARNVKVSMEAMRKKQFEAACTVLRRQHKFLKEGTMPDMTAADTRTAPVGDVLTGLDEQSLEVLEIKADGAEDDLGTHGAMRIRRRITYARPGRGQPVTRTMFFTTRTDIFNDQRNEKLGIVGGTLARTMDGVRKQLTIVCAKKGTGEVERRTFRFKSRKPAVRTRAPAARPAPVPRMSVRAPGAATKAELRKQKQEEAAELAAAQPKAQRPKGDVKSKNKSKPKSKDAPKAVKKKPEKDEEDTEDEEVVDAELSDAEADPAGLAVVDERDPEFVEYHDQYDESNSDIPDGGSDSDYNSIDSGAESEDKDFKAAAQREIRSQQRAKAGPTTGGCTTAAGGRRQKRGPKAGPKESDYDEEEMGQLDDLIDDGELEEAQATESEDDFSSGGDEETEDDLDEGGRPKAGKRAARKPVKRVALEDDDDSMEILGSTPAKKMRATANNTPFPVIDSPAAPAALLTGRARVKIKRQSAAGSKKSAQTGAARQRPPKLCRANSESTESEDDPGDELSTESEHQRPVRNAASGRAKRRNITPDSPHINASPDNSHERPHAGVVPAALIGEARVQADQEYQRRLRAPDLRSAAIRDLSTMFTSALNEAFASDFHIVQNVFKTAPSSATIPDYYEYVDRKDVITWTSLKKRQHTSRRALLEDIDRMAQNANKYNQGGLVRNPAFVPGGGEPEMIKRKPGLYALPELPARMDAFRKRVTDLLYGRFRTKAEKHELNILAAYLVMLEFDQGANVLWVECEKCQKWRIVSRKTFDRVQDDRFTCDYPTERPVRGCTEGPNVNDDEELLRVAKQELMPVQ